MPPPPPLGRFLKFIFIWFSAKNLPNLSCHKESLTDSNYDRLLKGSHNSVHTRLLIIFLVTATFYSMRTSSDLTKSLFLTADYNMTDSTCPACLEDYKDPRLLPCSHAVCLSCIIAIQKYGHVPCPVCECEHKVPPDEIEDLPVVSDVAELSTKMQVQTSFVI